jgi:hypothetical protein
LKSTGIDAFYHKVSAGSILMPPGIKVFPNPSDYFDSIFFTVSLKWG